MRPSTIKNVNNINKYRIWENKNAHLKALFLKYALFQFYILKAKRYLDRAEQGDN